MIIDPKTGHSTDRKRLVTVLMEWSSEPPIIAALIRAGRADYQGIAQLAHIVQLAVDEKDEGPAGDRTIAGAVVSFLVDPSVRATVARYVSMAHGLDFKQVKEDLYDLRVELTQQYHLAPADSPPFVSKEGAALVEEPAWVQKYRDSGEEMSPEGIAWLLRQPYEVQAALCELPPLSLVRSKPDKPLQFPLPGELAVVVAGEVRNGDVVISLAAAPGEGPYSEARAEWLELVACAGNITPERVKATLSDTKES